MALIPISPPLLEPVSLAELKEFCRVDASDTSQDNLIATLGMAARGWAETYTQRRFVQQTWRLLMDFFPGYIDLKLSGTKVSSPFVSGSNAVLVGIRYAIVLPYPPVQSVELFQYLDANGNTTVMDAGTDFTADVQSNPARLTPPFGQMWPVARVVVNAVQVDYKVGYANPIRVTTQIGSPPSPYKITSTNYSFGPSDIGRPISIPLAGRDGGTLNTVITGMVSPPALSAYIRDPALGYVTNAPALLVNAANGIPVHWEMIKTGIKMLVERWYEIRVPDENNIPQSVRQILSPMRDLRL
jgi:hypothetical protein